jgi:orotidine-5'-phosphate decarboxylase
MSGFEILKKPIFVALDIDDKAKALKIVEETHDIVGGFKVGPRLIFKYGTEIISEIAKRAPVFLDFKFYDIPSTMDSSIRAAFDAGVTFATIHTTSGAEALSLLAKTEEELSKKRPFHILAVTILTSFSEENLPVNFKKELIQSQVSSLVKMSVENGIESFVCSPHELKFLKEKFPKCNYVTPGIRTGTEKFDDQKRTATAQEALKWGASALVVGRPVLQAKDPRKFVEETLSL